MTIPNRVIVLAAGRGFQLDGISKVLIRHPADGRSILQHIVESFDGKQITVVVGFRAVQVMEEFPGLDYVVNPDWAMTNNAYSLGLALNDQPCYVISGDIFLQKSLIERLDGAAENLILTDSRENRTLTSIHCRLDEHSNIVETYQGPVRSVDDPESVGLIKISDPDLLRRWKLTCLEHGNLHAAQSLSFDATTPIASVPLNDDPFVEVNTTSDYLRLIERCRK